MKKGFTLIELIVTIALFLIVFGAIIASFVAAVRHQSIILAQQEALSQISYAMELMSRTLRMAAPPQNNSCVLQEELSNYSVSDSSIQFINSLEKGDCQQFSLESNVLKYVKDVINNPNDKFSLTSPRVNVESLKFLITTGVNQKPMVTILLVASSQVPGVGKMRFQTTLSQRN